MHWTNKAKILVASFAVMLGLTTGLRKIAFRSSAASQGPGSPSAAALPPPTPDAILECLKTVKGDAELERACVSQSPVRALASAAAKRPR
jgi:hypothetical protein